MTTTAPKSGRCPRNRHPPGKDLARPFLVEAATVRQSDPNHGRYRMEESDRSEYGFMVPPEGLEPPTRGLGSRCRSVRSGSRPFAAYTKRPFRTLILYAAVRRSSRR
jgi:hypothetical protein